MDPHQVAGDGGRYLTPARCHRHQAWPRPFFCWPPGITCRGNRCCSDRLTPAPSRSPKIGRRAPHPAPCFVFGYSRAPQRKAHHQGSRCWRGRLPPQVVPKGNQLPGVPEVRGAPRRARRPSLQDLAAGLAASALSLETGPRGLSARFPPLRPSCRPAHWQTRASINTAHRCRAAWPEWSTPWAPRRRSSRPRQRWHPR